MTGNTLLGHMLAKVDRASAEQGVADACPCSTGPDVLICAASLTKRYKENGTLKPLLKAQLDGWPASAYRAAQAWLCFQLAVALGGVALRRIARACPLYEAIETFGDFGTEGVEVGLFYWTTKIIMGHFGEAWRLLAWSLFLRRFSQSRYARSSATQRQRGITVIAR